MAPALPRAAGIPCCHSGSCRRISPTDAGEYAHHVNYHGGSLDPKTPCTLYRGRLIRDMRTHNERIGRWGVGLVLTYWIQTLHRHSTDPSWWGEVLVRTIRITTSSY